MKALYHQPGGSVELEVLSKPKDGQADLGRDGAVLVSGVLISKEATPGTCTLIDDPADAKAKAEADAKAKAKDK